MVFIAYLSQKIVKSAPMHYVVVCHNGHVPNFSVQSPLTPNKQFYLVTLAWCTQSMCDQ